MKQKTVLIIGHTWPEPKSTAAGSRMLQLINTFKLENYPIVFASASHSTMHTCNLEALGVQSESIVLNDSCFDDFVIGLNPGVVVFDRFMTEEQFGWRVAEHCPNALRVLDTEDLHCLRKAREEAVKNNQPFSNDFLFSNIAKREIASIYRCDLSLIISQAEVEVLKTQFKIPEFLLYYLPFLLDFIDADLVKRFPSFENRQHFITIGNFLHTPNYDAVLQLKKHIWPKIKQQLSKAELHIYGAYTSEKVTQLHNAKQGFLIKGYVEDVNDVMQKTRVCLAPLRFGAGLKGKLFDAMQNGTPSIMTTIAAEGIFETTESVCVEDDFNDFVDSAVMLYTDALLWRKQQQLGYKTINSKFDKTQFQTNFLTHINNLCENLPQHRQYNFMGQILQYQTLQSTKFMSKWIEEKNKKQ